MPVNILLLIILIRQIVASSSPTSCDNLLVSPRIFTQCVNTKFCISFGSSPLPGGGILGNVNQTDVTDATIGTCPKNPDAIKNALINQTDNFSCNDENCKAPAVNDFKMSDPDTNNTLTREAKTSCAIGEYGLMCIKDNDWICTGSTDSFIFGQIQLVLV